MPTEEELRTEKEFLAKIHKTLEEAFSKFIGDRLTYERLFDAAQEALKGILGPVEDEASDILKEYILLSFGVGSAFTLEKIIKGASDVVINMLFERLGMSIQMVELEWMVRHDRLKSWKVNSEDKTDGKVDVGLSVEPHQPLNFIKVEFTL